MPHSLASHFSESRTGGKEVGTAVVKDNTPRVTGAAGVGLLPVSDPATVVTTTHRLATTGT